jgi:hypothetical protein
MGQPCNHERYMGTLIMKEVGQTCSEEAAHGLHSVMASKPNDRSLYYKKKTMATKVTPEINLVYPWSPLPCTPCKQVLIWASPTMCERGGTS